MSQGVRIADLENLMHCAMHHRSVYCPGMHAWRKPRPAAFVQNLQARIVHQMIRRGLFVYLPKHRNIPLIK